MANRKLDEYQTKEFYIQNTKARENGFAKFEKDGSHYFALYKDGDIVLLSQAYTGVAGRDNGIESVKKNQRISKRYRYDVRAGNQHGFGLYAGNGQEIAISANLNSRAEAERVAGRLNGSVRTASKKATPRTAAPKARAASNEDNYKRLSFYKRQTKGRNNGIESFKGDDGQYYFAHFENGKIRLISESYPTATARDTGAASVEKNIRLENRYDFRGPLKNGKYDYRLKAGNGKEIARSVWYGSAASATTGAAYLIGTRKRAKPKAKVAVVRKAAPAASATPRVAKAARPKATKPAKPTKKVAPVAKAAKPKPAKSTNKVAPVAKAAKSKPAKSTKKVAPVAAVAAAAAIPAMAAATRSKTVVDKDDDYLKCEEYHGHKIVDQENNVAFFSRNNLEYFVIYDDNGDVRLRSEGFKLISKRSSELAAVLRLKDTKSAYKRIEKAGHYMDILYDEKGREVGRSCLRKIKPVAKKAKPTVSAKAAAPVAAVAAAAAIPAMASAAKYKAPVDKDDDYLKCEAYHGHKVTDKVNNVAFFSHKNKEYFVLYDDNGDVRLRSEGFQSISKRSSELNAVLRLKDTKSAYKRVEKAGYVMDILYDENGREVGRSCLRKIAPVVKAAAPVAAATAAAAVAAPVVAAKVAAPVVAAKVAAPVVAAKVAAPVVAAKVAAPAAAAATTGGGLGFLRWLIPLLLALLAAIFLFKYCKPTPPKVALPVVSCWDGSEATNRAACPIKVTCWDGSHVKDAASCPIEPVKVETFTCWDGSEVEALSSCPVEAVVEPAPEPIVVPEPITNVSRICGPSSNVLFDVPNYSPKTVTYLGSNPQYGNSHGMSTGQFYEKLLAAHLSGGMDRAFLNLMARSMGYNNFRDMSAADISDDTISNGSKGLLGVSRSHILQYSKIQTNDASHLEAFRLRSLNGTDLHIMKSCGNYMYVCN